MGDNVKNIYKTRYKDVDLTHKNKIWKLIVERFYARHVPSNAVVMDVASGHGEFINNVNSRTRIAVDLNPDAKFFLDEDVVFYNDDIFSVLKSCNASIDVIFVSNFLEHIRSKELLQKFISLAHGALKDGGKILVVGPNIRFLYREYWDYIDHHIPLSHFTVAEVLQLSAFKVSSIVPRFLPHSDPGKKLPPLILPYLYMRLPFLWRFFGKQFFVCAIK